MKKRAKKQVKRNENWKNILIIILCLLFIVLLVFAAYLLIKSSFYPDDAKLKQGEGELGSYKAQTILNNTDSENISNNISNIYNNTEVPNVVSNTKQYLENKYGSYGTWIFWGVLFFIMISIILLLGIIYNHAKDIQTDENQNSENSNF